MSDNELDPPLSPQQEAAVRRALAAAGGPEPMPEQIAARLDGVIAELAAERSADDAAPAGAHERGIVVPLDPAARRRRTRVRVLLGAAAAVIAVAVGAGILKDREDDVTAADQIAEDNPARSDSGNDAAAPNEAASEAPGATSGAPSDVPSRSSLSATAYPNLKRVVTDEPLREIHADALRADLVALQQAALPHAAADYQAATLSAPAAFRCEPADFGAGYLVGVTYEGKPAVVAFRKPMGSTQVAEVLACGTGDTLRSTSIAAAR